MWQILSQWDTRIRERGHLDVRSLGSSSEANSDSIRWCESCLAFSISRKVMNTDRLPWDHSISTNSLSSAGMRKHTFSAAFELLLWMSASPVTKNAFPINLATALWLKLHRESWHFPFSAELLKCNIFLTGKRWNYYNVENTPWTITMPHPSKNSSWSPVALVNVEERNIQKQDDQTLQGSSVLDLAHWPNGFSFGRKGATMK